MRKCDYPGRKCSYSSDHDLSLIELIELYKSDYRPHVLDHFEWYSEPIDFAKVIERSVASVERSGIMFDHQRRVADKLPKIHKELIAGLHEIKRVNSFTELLATISTLCGKIFKSKHNLTYYDIATRLGWKLQIFPDRVYLHHGVKKGAKALGLDISKGYLLKEDLPQRLTDELDLYEIEDFLCIFKNHL